MRAASAARARSARWRRRIAPNATSTTAPPAICSRGELLVVDDPRADDRHDRVGERHHRGDGDVDVVVRPGHEAVSDHAREQDEPEEEQPVGAVDRAEIVGRDQRPRDHHHARADEHRGEQRPRVDVGLADALAEHEVPGEDEQVEEGVDVALQRRAGAARAGHDHDHARERQGGEPELGPRTPFAEHAGGEQQDQHRLQRGDERRVDDRRLLERREAEDEAEREAHARWEGDHAQPPGDAPAERGTRRPPRSTCRRGRARTRSC